MLKEDRVDDIKKHNHDERSDHVFPSHGRRLLIIDEQANKFSKREEVIINQSVRASKTEYENNRPYFYREAQCKVKS